MVVSGASDIGKGRHKHLCSSPLSALPSVKPARELLSSDAGGKTMLAGVGGVESNFMLLTTPCITSYDHPDFPAILVYIECLCALEVHMYMCMKHSKTLVEISVSQLLV